MMKYIKLFEEKYWKVDQQLDRYKTKVNIAKIKSELEKYRIENYYVHPDGTVDVNGYVHLYGRGLNKIPFKFGKVTSSFACYDNYLSSLEGCPYYVGGDFNCSDNSLTDLTGGPDEVDGSYVCKNCHLISLKGIASEIKCELDCKRNELTDLDISSNIGWSIACGGNKIDPKNYSFYGELGGRISFNNSYI